MADLACRDLLAAADNDGIILGNTKLSGGLVQPVEEAASDLPSAQRLAQALRVRCGGDTAAGKVVDYAQASKASTLLCRPSTADAGPVAGHRNARNRGRPEFVGNRPPAQLHGIPARFDPDRHR